MKFGERTLLYVFLGGLLLAGLFLSWYLVQPGKFDVFAKCLGDKEAIFYGAFWCPHCQEQKAMFGKSKNLLPYVECSTPDKKGQLPECVEREIKNYPTWEFSDETRETGVLTLQELAEKTSCPLP